MQALKCPELFEIDENQSKAEKFWNRIPFLGTLISDYLWKARVWPLVGKVERQLKERAKPPSKVWGEDEKRVALGQLICATAKENMGWPNDHFIPEDPVTIVFWEHEDGLDFEFAVFDIEGECDIKIQTEEAESWFNGNLAQMVDAIYLKQTAQYHT